jgi:hypothetical protein
MPTNQPERKQPHEVRMGRCGLPPLGQTLVDGVLGILDCRVAVAVLGGS